MTGIYGRRRQCLVRLTTSTSIPFVGACAIERSSGDGPARITTSKTRRSRIQACQASRGCLPNSLLIDDGRRERPLVDKPPVPPAALVQKSFQYLAEESPCKAVFLQR